MTTNSMLNIMTMLLAPAQNYYLLKTIQVSIFCLLVVCSIFLIVVILLQSSNSSGIDAISGETETFLGKNEASTKEGFLKKLTVIAVILLAILSIAFFIVQIIPW